MRHFSLKHAICIMFTTIQMAVFANYDSMPIGYHSIGIDTYGDGVTPVMDGECYALAWVASGNEFKGFKYDGTLVDPMNNKIVDDDGMLYICPIAKDGKCPPVSFLVNSKFIKDNPNGEYKVVVLDTRKSESELCDICDNNLPCRINGWGFANVSKAKSLSGIFTGNASIVGSTTSISSEMPENVRVPIITEFKFDDKGNVVIHFTNTMECFSYFVEYGKTVKSIGEFKNDILTEGSPDAEEAFVISIPSSNLPDESAFFKVSAKTDWVSENVR